MSKPQKLQNYKFGLFAEMMIIIRLFFCGHRIIAWRYKTPLGEIDIITRRGRHVIFIEVKARKDKEVSEVVTVFQQKRISDAAQMFIARNARYMGCDFRFDLIIFNSILSLKYIKNAWEGF